MFLCGLTAWLFVFGEGVAGIKTEIGRESVDSLSLKEGKELENRLRLAAFYRQLENEAAQRVEEDLVEAKKLRHEERMAVIKAKQIGWKENTGSA